jgi:gamma-glutamylputrescine oxidase
MTPPSSAPPTTSLDTWYARSCLEAPLDAPPLTGRETAAIGIVGGGLAGLAVALGLAERGARPVLLEVATVGAGASGRNGGLLSAGFTRDFESLCRKLGAGDATTLFRLSVDAVRLVERRIRDGAIACRLGHGVLEASWFDRPAALRAFIDEQNRLFDRKLQFWPRDDLRRQFRSDHYWDGIFDPLARHLDPLALCRGYARLARAASARLFEASPAVTLERRQAGPKGGAGGPGWRVTTRSGGVLEVDQLILATNAARPALDRRLGRGLIPVNTYIIVTEPLPGSDALPIRAPHAVYDDRFATGYYRLVEDDATGGKRLLWGGRIGIEASPPDLVDRLRADLGRVYPELAAVPIAQGWAGEMGFARHKMPVVARLEPGLWVTTGFAGHGLNTTTMAGELLARALLDEDDAWRLLAPFGLPRIGGRLGTYAAQALYQVRALEDELVARWHRRRRPSAALASPAGIDGVRPVDGPPRQRR